MACVFDTRDRRTASVSEPSILDAFVAFRLLAIAGNRHQTSPMTFGFGSATVIVRYLSSELDSTSGPTSTAVSIRPFVRRRRVGRRLGG